MSNAQKQPPIQHLPPHRAQGLDEDVTAQPRPIADELALEASAEPELSVDPEDLGSRFLSDAVEQGDFNPDQPFPEDASLAEGPARDQPLGSTNFVAGNSVWEQTVDLENRTQGASDQLREPALFTEADDFDAQLDREEAEADSGRVSATRIRAADAVSEQSLFDREGEEGDDTIAPELDLDEQGSEPEPRISALRPKANPDTPLQAAAHTLLDKGAKLLRAVADRLHRTGS